jgi:hypothetical protein
MSVHPALSPGARSSASRAVLATGTAAVIVLGAASSRAQGPQAPAPAFVDAEVAVPHATGLPELQAREHDAPWTTACVPPCRLRLPLDAEYRIAGDGIVDSEIFRLPPAEKVRVEGHVGSSMLRRVGGLLGLGGLIFAAGGTTILLFPNDPGASSDARGSKTIVGAGFLGMGVVAAAVGALAWAFSDTNVDVAVAR